MKKKASIVTAIVLFLAVLCCGVAAAVYINNSRIKVYVSISSTGEKLDLASECIKVKDKDKDGKITINDALNCAHEKYSGGSATGYAVYNSPDIEGVSLLRLWGVSADGSFGYYVNNESSLSLMDEVKENDHVYAYVYTDRDGFSDAYSFFDERERSEKAGQEFKLTLSKFVYDSAWQLNEVKAEGAEITVDGEKTGCFTDSNGEASISVDSVGKHIVSAVAPDGEIITPPVCVVEIKN